MLYCENCQVLSRDEDRCPLCGGKKLREVQPDDPVLLLTTDESESQRIAAAFEDAEIPHMERSLGTGGYMSIILGQTRCAQIRVFVPFGKIESAREVLRGIGFLNDGAGEPAPVLREERTTKNDEEEKKEIPMSRGKRLAVRIFSIILFIAVIWLVVDMADSIVGLFKSAFHSFQ